MVLASGTVAGEKSGFVACALALARRRHGIRTWGIDRLSAGRTLPRGAATAVPLALLSAFLLAVGGLSVLPGGAPSPPPPRCCAALRATVAGLGMGRPERLLAPFEQTPPQPGPTRPLTGSRGAAKLEWAQGSGELPTARPRARSPYTLPRGVLTYPVGLPGRSLLPTVRPIRPLSKRRARLRRNSPISVGCATDRNSDARSDRYRMVKGSPRAVERCFGWGRETVLKGLREASSGLRCVEDFAARGRRRSEDKDPGLAAEIRAIVEPHSYADPDFRPRAGTRTCRRGEVREALVAGGRSEARLPSERTLRDILNRMNYRLKRIQKGKPLKKTEETDAIFANVKRVKEEAKADPEALEISMDTKAKVSLGAYSRGEKPGPTRPVRCPRGWTTIRPRRRSWSRSGPDGRDRGVGAAVRAA